MKKTPAMILILVLALAACGGKGDSPLTRSGGGSASAGVTGNLSGYDAATRQAMIDSAKADGGDMEFKADGSAVYTDAEGNKTIQHPDGSWTIEDTDGSTGQLGGEWPNNEFTQLLPKPDFSFAGTSMDNNSFEVSFMGVEVEQVKDYANKVKAKGFTRDENTQDETVMGMTIYEFSAKNAAGYEVSITFAMGMAGLTIEKR